MEVPDGLNKAEAKLMSLIPHHIDVLERAGLVEVRRHRDKDGAFGQANSVQLKPLGVWMLRLLREPLPPAEPESPSPPPSP